MIGFTSPDGLQLTFDTEKLEIYDKGNLRATFNITEDIGRFLYFLRVFLPPTDTYLLYKVDM